MHHRKAIYYDNLAQVQVAKGDLGAAKVSLTKAYQVTEKACGKDSPLCQQARQLMLNPPQVCVCVCVRVCVLVCACLSVVVACGCVLEWSLADVCLRMCARVHACMVQAPSQ